MNIIVAHHKRKTRNISPSFCFGEISGLHCSRVFFSSLNLYMMTQGMAQQTGRQMGITAAPPYAPLALDSDSDAFAECLAANFNLPLDLPPIFFDFFSKVRDCLIIDVIKSKLFYIRRIKRIITKIGTSFFVNIL